METISRRQFLKLSGAAAVGLGLTLPGCKSAGNEGGQDQQQSNFEITPQDVAVARAFLTEQELSTLEKAGLGEFVDIYANLQVITFPLNHPNLRLYTGIGVLDEINQVCSAVIKGESAEMQERINALNEGWGTSISPDMVERELQFRAVEDAVEILNVKPPLTDKQIRQYLVQVGLTLPGLRMAFADKIVTVDSGGEAGAPHIMLSLSTDNEKYLDVTTYHEGMHSVHTNWHRMKPFTQKTAFLDYYSKYSFAIMSSYRQWAALDSAQKKQYKSGSQLIEHDRWTEKVDERIAGYRSHIEPHVKAKIPASLDQADPITKLNSLVEIIAELINMTRSDAETKQSLMAILESDETAAMELSSLISMGVNEHSHYLVGPPQRDGGGFPDSEAAMYVRGGLLEALNIAMFNASIPMIAGGKTPAVREIRNALSLLDEKDNIELAHYDEWVNEVEKGNTTLRLRELSVVQDLLMSMPISNITFADGQVSFSFNNYKFTSVPGVRNTVLWNNALDPNWRNPGVYVDINDSHILDIDLMKTLVQSLVTVYPSAEIIIYNMAEPDTYGDGIKLLLNMQDVVISVYQEESTKYFGIQTALYSPRDAELLKDTIPTHVFLGQNQVDEDGVVEAPVYLNQNTR